MAILNVDENFRNIWKNSNIRVYQFHEEIVSIINEEKYDKLVDICREILKGKFSLHEIDLVKKIIFDLINLQETYYAISIYKLYLDYNPHAEDFSYKIFYEFLKYDNYSGVLETAMIYLDYYYDIDLSIVYKFITRLLELGTENSKILKLITKILKINPKNEFVRELIYKAINIRNYLIAIEIYIILLEINIDPTSFFLNILILLNENGEYQKVKELCKKSIKQFPKSVNHWTAAGYTYTKLRRYKKSLIMYEYALKLTYNKNEKQKAMVWSYIALTYNYLKEYNNAIETSKLALTFNPSSTFAYNQLGFAYYKKGAIKQGLKLILKALELNKNYYPAWANLCKIYLKLHNFNEAYSACFNSLCLNNQFLEGIVLYRQLSNNPLLAIIKKVLPKLSKFGYREVIPLDEKAFSQEFLEKQRYIFYSENFQDFLSNLTNRFSENIVAIYAQLPVCTSCKELLILYGERINLKSGYRTYFLKCRKCGKSLEKIINLKEEDIPNIKVYVILKSSLNSICEIKKIRLSYEKLIIYYIPIGFFKNKVDLKFISQIENNVLLYGQDIRTINIEEVMLNQNSFKNALEYYQEKAEERK